MKRKLYGYIMTLAAVMLVASCAEKMSDEEMLAGRDKTTLAVSYSLSGEEVRSVACTNAAVRKTLEVNVNSDGLKWNLESDKDWCQVVQEEHRGSGTVTLSIAANETFEAREPATLTFVAGDYRGFSITVTQSGSSFIIGQPYFAAANTGATYNVDVTTPAGQDFDFTADEWLEVTKGTSVPEGDNEVTPLTVKVAENATSSRYGSVVISDGNVSEHIWVYQFGNDYEYDADGNLVIQAADGSEISLTAPQFMIDEITAPKFAVTSVTDNTDGTSTIRFVFNENLSDCAESRPVELSLLLANASGTEVKLPDMIQGYIPANGLVTAKGMIAFAQAVAAGASTADWEENGVVTMKSDIDMSEITEWHGIGTKEAPFTGKFNGNGYAVTDLKKASVGLFGYCEGATIEDVIIGEGTSLYRGEAYTGEDGWLGGVVSVAKSTTVSDCEFAADIEFGGTNDDDEPAYIGALVGYADESSVVTKSKMTGKILIASPSTGIETYVGGVVGMSKGTVTNNEMLGEVEARTGNLLTVGGITSVLTAETTVGGNAFTGKLIMADGNTTQMIFGGLYGTVMTDRSFDMASDKSVTLGTININGYAGSTSTVVFVGGFVGKAEADVTLSFNGYAAQTNIHFDQSAINRETSYACIGGVLGGCDPSAKSTLVSFENVSNQGEYSTAFTYGSGTTNPVKLSRGFVGGVAGFINGKAIFKNCTNQGFLGRNLKDNWNGRSNGYFMVFGGITGVVIGGDAEFADCTNQAEVINRFYSNRYSGAGYVTDSWNNPCTAGGILGAFEYKTSGSGKLTMTNCVNSNIVQSFRGNVGGILGFARNATITSCTNTGELNMLTSGEADAPFKGGIAAWIVGESSIMNCVAKCTVHAGAPGGSVHHPGGIISLAQGKVTIDGCSYFGDVKSYPASGITSVCGGIVSQASDETVIKDCMFGGTVEGIPISANNVELYAVGNKADVEETVTNITWWNGNL